MSTADRPRVRDRHRKRVYERDDYRCQHCDRQDDPRRGAEIRARRIVPASRGGTDHPRNLVTLCRTCHERLPEHHVIGSADRIELAKSPDSSEPAGGGAAERALLIVGGCVLPFFTTLFLMTL